MSDQVDVEPTAKVIDDIAEELELKVRELRRIAVELRETGNFDCAGEAAATVATLTRNMRLDLLVMRPLRQFGHK
ncbi:TPA: hypothetical protein NIF38_000703 [Pseudomonas aeruginosa]|uniref:hypothetical protein n=1 Tax=Pseudomonas aeruginosa TaxID=287 RepID=UPI000FD2A086|nr:hypothetical protein [Pseudomonas aeruginosa]RUG15332.1 hypothetical protein IPC762_26175 [Pseudomonas aeruginosa]HCF4721602.1 hypothetical protein [Pseudomonas aeruginosa]